MSYRAKMKLPFCTYGSCPGPMYLQMGAGRPYYECSQDGKPGSMWECPNARTRDEQEREEWAARGNQIFPEDIRTKYVMDGERMKPSPTKTDERISPGELETAL